MQDKLEAYLSRIGLNRVPDANADGVAQIQFAHRRSIAFENLDIPLGLGIAIGSAAVFDKLILRGRGGYCFEQNRLFSDMMDAAGIANRPLMARVLLQSPADDPPPRTHVLLLALLEGRAWIADAGFGGSMVPPLPLEDGAHAVTPDGAAHRLRRIGEAGMLPGEWLLERAGPPAATDGRAAPHTDWQAQYAFDLAQVAPMDLEMGNHWTSTRHGTRFTSLVIASIVSSHGFTALTGRHVRACDGGITRERMISDVADFGEILAGEFGLMLNDADVARLWSFTESG